MKTERLISIVLFAVLCFATSHAVGKGAAVPIDSGIQPTTNWNTFLGGNGVDQASGICRDDNGNSYVVGTSSAEWGGDQIKNPYAGGKDAFLAKVDAEGNLQWVTFLGSGADDEGNALDCYHSSLYVAGTSGASWGTTIRRNYSGGKDGFLAKFNTDGDLAWNAFLGGSGDDEAKDVVKTSLDWTYLVGSSTAAWGNNIVRNYAAGKDGYLVRIEENGSIAWITFLGGTGTDEANQLDVTFVGTTAIFNVVGSSNATWGSPFGSFVHRGKWDAFFFIQTAGTYFTNLFLGGPGDDFGTSIKVADTIYIGGDSDADWGWASPKRSFTQGKDAFVANITLSGLNWFTFLGGNGMDKTEYLDLASIESEGTNVFAMGSSDLSWGTPLPPFTHQGGRDAFAAMLSTGGDLILSGFYGGSGDDELRKAISSGHGSYYVVGSSTATWGTPKRPFSANLDAFVADVALQTLLNVKRIYLPLVVR
ncbi:MAG: SBBP repeat-containing protein [Anaerolineales bacterium]|nr:SBBP repeat-containing protein [Anaerolineales bacterium]